MKFDYQFYLMKTLPQLFGNILILQREVKKVREEKNSLVDDSSAQTLIKTREINLAR